MAGVLASVADPDEALRVVALGVEVVDLKDPARGSLGAWALPALRAVRTRLGGVLTSATIGDLPLEPAVVRRRVEAVAATGVDVVKIGFFPGDLDGTLAALRPLARRGIRLAAVVFADRGLDPALAGRLGASGFRAVVVDTADKDRGRLGDHADAALLDAFLKAARAAGLITALAGSLREADVAALAPLDPDLFGFRGALCAGGRNGRLDPARVRTVVAAVRRPAPRRPDLAGLRIREGEAGDGEGRRHHVDGVGERGRRTHQRGEAQTRPFQAGGETGGEGVAAAGRHHRRLGR